MASRRMPPTGSRVEDNGDGGDRDLDLDLRPASSAPIDLTVSLPSRSSPSKPNSPFDTRTFPTFLYPSQSKPIGRPSSYGALSNMYISNEEKQEFHFQSDIAPGVNISVVFLLSPSHESHTCNRLHMAPDYQPPQSDSVSKNLGPHRAAEIRRNSHGMFT